MSNLEQMADNLSYMKDFKPLTEEEHAAIKQVCYVMKEKDLIPCTACRYCVEGCPAGIVIPELISCANSKKMYPGDWNPEFYYSLHIKTFGKASDCIGCGACEDICPQHLPVRGILAEIAEAFEKKKDEDE